MVTIPGVVETFKSVFDKITYGTTFKLINLLHTENANLTSDDLKTSIAKLENWWNVQLVSYDTLTSRGKPSSNGQLSHCLWSFGIFDKSHWYKMKSIVAWRMAMNARIGLKLQVSAMPWFHSLYDWCFQTMWLFSGSPEDSEDETLIEKHGAEALYSAVKSSMRAMLTEDADCRQDEAHRMIQIIKPWTIQRWSESKLANRQPLVCIPKVNAHLVDLDWTEEQQDKLGTLRERYTSEGASGEWRVHRWRLAWFYWYWETPKIGMTLQDNGTLNSHSILGWILWFTDGWETHFCPCLSLQLRSIPNLTTTNH
jgi:hypothetical protein